MDKNGKHIVIITGQHMTANPRVWKEANTLAANGYKVTILTTFYDRLKQLQDLKLLHPDVRYKAAVNLIPDQGTLEDRIFSRMKCRIAVLKKRIFKKDSKHLLVYSPAKQVKRALKENADLYVAHQEAGLIVGCELLRKGKKVAFDIEDWYSCDYTNALRPVVLLKRAELFAFKHAAYITCPSRAMCEKLIKAYAPTKKVEVIYNGFSITESKNIARHANKNNSLIWFSQVIGPERGLETLMSSLAYMKTPLEIHLVGKITDAYKSILQQLAPRNHSFFFHELMEHYQLLPFLTKFKIGLAIENKFPESRNSTVTNKILQYLQAGNKVLATNTQGQAEIAEAFPESVLLVDVNEPVQWARAIETLMDSSVPNRKQSLSVFDSQFSWQAQEKKLLKIIQDTLNS